MSPQLSIVIPAYNEELRLPASLERVRGFVRGLEAAGGPVEVLIVDDGSRDRTAQVAEEIGRDWPGLRVLRNPGNRGKGYSVRHGMLEAAGDWLLFSDADFSAPIEEFHTLKSKADEGYDVVIGSRALRPELVGVHQSAFRELSGKFFNLIMRIITGLPFHDTQCGFKMMRRGPARDIFSRQKIEGFGFDVEVLYIARKLGYRAAEVPVRWNNVEGTKVGMLTGLTAFSDLARVRWWAATGQYNKK